MVPTKIAAPTTPTTRRGWGCMAAAGAASRVGWLTWRSKWLVEYLRCLLARCMRTSGYVCVTKS